MIKRLILLCAFVSGCGFYFGHGGDDDCIYNGDGGAGVASQGYRDPSTGTCTYYDNNHPCDGKCGPCAEPATPASPDWGSCNSACDGLDENSCIAAAGCHAAYLDSGYGALVPSEKFYGCWATAPQYGADPAGTCAGQGAQSCSQLDHCSMVYTGANGQTTGFEACVDEASNACPPCPNGSHCEHQCTPCNSLGCDDTCPATCVSNTTCDQVDCGVGSQCIEQCSGDSCAPVCVPIGGPGQCTGTLQCSSAPPVCPANTTPGIANGCWTGYCIPNAACGTQDPGQCYATVTCGSSAPSCPAGTLPGVTNGCYSGYCIPTYSCEVPACESLGTEDACTARNDCTPVYTGSDCTCTPQGCTCVTETYARCESLYMAL